MGESDEGACGRNVHLNLVPTIELTPLILLPHSLHTRHAYKFPTQHKVLQCTRVNSAVPVNPKNSNSSILIYCPTQVSRISTLILQIPNNPPFHSIIPAQPPSQKTIDLGAPSSSSQGK
jgi:hypothetical protein